MEGGAGDSAAGDAPAGDSAAGASAADPPAPAITARARRARLLVAALVLGLLIAGSAWGQDDHFPFGPFRMFATRQHLDGTTSWYLIEAVTADGGLVFLPGPTYGMRRAELEGQIPRFVTEPALLEELAVAYERRRPAAPSLVEIHLVKRRQHLDAGRPVGEPIDETVATWRR